MTHVDLGAIVPTMSDGGFQQPNSIAPPQAFGRIFRLALGVFTLFISVLFIINFDWLIRAGAPPLPVWIFPAAALYLLPVVVNMGLGRNWGRRPQLAVAAAGLVIALVGLIVAGSLWSLPLAWFVYLSGQLVFLSLGVSFLLASVMAVPG